MRISIVFVLVSFLVTACFFNDGGRVGENSLNCGNHARGSGLGQSGVLITIDRLVPSGTDIHCSGQKSFPYQDGGVALVYVAYGRLQSCPSGCVSSHLCGIYDPDDAELYSFSWYGPDEQPTSIPPDCPELGEASYGSSYQCNEPPSGALHPITETEAFQSFRESQRENNGDWNVCFR